jgi:hypothetical protein
VTELEYSQPQKISRSDDKDDVFETQLGRSSRVAGNPSVTIQKRPNDEVLAVWNPADLEVDAGTFRIGSATALRWTEYCCWPKTPENIRYWDFALEDARVAYRTNEDRIPGSGWLDGSTTSSYPAVEISESY